MRYKLLDIFVKIINIPHWQVYIIYIYIYNVVDILVFADPNQKMADLTRLRFKVVIFNDYSYRSACSGHSTSLVCFASCNPTSFNLN